MKVIKIEGNCPAIGEPKQPLTMLLATDSSILLSNKPFFIPDFAGSFAIHTTLAVRIGRLGKNIASRFAHRYCDAVAASLVVKPQKSQSTLHDFDARHTAFDGSFLLGDFVQLPASSTHLHINTFVGEQQVDSFDSQAMHIDLDHLIEQASQYFTLKMGDILAISNNTSKHTLAIGETITAQLNGQPSLTVRIK